MDTCGSIQELRNPIPKVIMMKNDNTTSNQKVAIVTGASGGIGLGMAKTLLERGYRVVANSRNITKSKTLASSENLLLVDGDIGTKEIAVKVVDAAVQKFGRVDLLVNNAGIFIPKPFTDYTVEDFNNVLSTNLAGFFYVSQEAIVQMRKQKSGHVVNITTSLVDQPDCRRLCRSDESDQGRIADRYQGARH